MKNKLPQSSNRATTITKSIGVFITKDMRRYSVVYHVVRIKNHQEPISRWAPENINILHNRIEIESNHKEYESLHPYKRLYDTQF